MKRHCLLLFLLASCAHMNPSTSIGVVAAPEPRTIDDTTFTRGLQLTSRIAQRSGLLAQPREYSGRRWHECFSLPEREWTVCDRVSKQEIQVLFHAPGHLVLPRLADKLRMELSDSLRARYGAGNVRECEWSRISCSGT